MQQACAAYHRDYGRDGRRHASHRAAVMVLLGVSNLAFWPIYTTTGMTAAGVVLTSLHLGFALAQFHATRRVELRLA